MNNPLHTIDIDTLYLLTETQQLEAIQALESGQVVFLPRYYFDAQQAVDNDFFSEKLLDGKHKNISFDSRTKRLGGYNKDNHALKHSLTEFMDNYADFAKQLVETLFPTYRSQLICGRTSYRPAEIKGRASSKRKDDTRVHVDSFAASPVNGLRILRVFCNINPHGQPRVWELGESFPQVLQRFSAQVTRYNRGIAKLLQWTKITKSLRSAYDHYQLQLHDRMKLDDHYQQMLKKTRVDFPALSTWIVFTDQVSHAALGGQFLLEQTFYLPVEAMKQPETSPLKHWEKKDLRTNKKPA